MGAYGKSSTDFTFQVHSARHQYLSESPLQRRDMKRLIIAAALIGWLIPAPLAPQARTGIVTGTIRKPDGTPAQHVRVGVLEPGVGTAPAAIVGVTESDDTGQFRLEGIPPGQYHVTAGRLSLPTYFPGVMDQAA